MQDPIIDWELAIKLAGNSREFAEKMFALLIKDLPDELLKIKEAYSKHHFADLKHRIHKLHGALCYCGAPRLKAVTAALEFALDDETDTQVPALIAQFELEVNALIKQVTCPAP